jgi:hypothetical protein
MRAYFDKFQGGINMAATFSWAQYTGSAGNSTTPGGSTLMGTSSSTNMSWDFETADQTGTTNYTSAPVSAGSASYPVWLKGYFSNTVAFTVSNVKVWQFNPGASSANTASFTVFGTAQTAYSVASATSTSITYASNVQVPTAANSTGSPAGPLVGFGTLGSNAATTGVLQNYLALQLSAAAAAPAGTSGYFGYTMQYDEQ